MTINENDRGSFVDGDKQRVFVFKGQRQMTGDDDKHHEITLDAAAWIAAAGLFDDFKESLAHNISKNT